MRNSLKTYLIGAAFGSALAFAAPASAAVTISSPCDSVTDGDAQGCKFDGNIDTSDSGGSSYLLTEAAYNAAFDPNITLTPLADFQADDGDASSGGIHLDLAADLKSGSWTVDPGVVIEYFAVKAGPEFILYEYIGVDSFTTAGLTNNRGIPHELSHIVFFGSSNPIPEPATWAMMILGLAMIGSSMRRRGQKLGGSIVLA